MTRYEEALMMLAQIDQLAALRTGDPPLELAALLMQSVETTRVELSVAGEDSQAQALASMMSARRWVERYAGSW